ncbi:MAG: hypothetical protein AAGA09_01170 [Pseudomonadota bacterium]
MELIVKLSWALLALIHATPALAFFKPSLVEKLYGVAPAGETGILLVHRGALFFAVFIAAFIALFDPASRRLASIVVAISVIGFLIVYSMQGMPEGSLTKIAIADLVALAPLLIVSVNAWRS